MDDSLTEPRMVTITRRFIPVDVIAPQHREIDAELSQWGQWSCEGRSALRCRSVEGAYRPRNGNIDRWEFEPPRPSPVSVPNLRMREIDRAVLRVPEGHRNVLVLHYVAMARPERICRAVAIPQRDFGHWLFTARCMVVNLLREMDLTSPNSGRTIRGQFATAEHRA